MILKTQNHLIVMVCVYVCDGVCMCVCDGVCMCVCDGACVCDSVCNGV